MNQDEGNEQETIYEIFSGFNSLEGIVAKRDEILAKHGLKDFQVVFRAGESEQTFRKFILSAISEEGKGVFIANSEGRSSDQMQFLLSTLGNIMMLLSRILQLPENINREELWGEIKKHLETGGRGKQ